MTALLNMTHLSPAPCHISLLRILLLSVTYTVHTDENLLSFHGTVTLMTLLNMTHPSTIHCLIILPALRICFLSAEQSPG